MEEVRSRMGWAPWRWTERSGLVWMDGSNSVCSRAGVCRWSGERPSVAPFRAVMPGFEVAAPEERFEAVEDEAVGEWDGPGRAWSASVRAV